MDTEAALKDLKAALALLPVDMVKNLLSSLFGNPLHLVACMHAWPEVRRLMEPHFKAGMVAYASGMLDMDELTQGFQAIVAEYL